LAECGVECLLPQLHPGARGAAVPDRVGGLPRPRAGRARRARRPSRPSPHRAAKLLLGFRRNLLR